MNGPSGHPPAGSAHRPFPSARQQDPHTDPSHRPSRPRRAARSVTLRHAPHHTSCTSTSAAPHKATSRTSATRKTSDAARSSFSSPRHTRPPPCHRYVPLRTRRLSSPDGVLLSPTTTSSFIRDIGAAHARDRRARAGGCLVTRRRVRCFFRHGDRALSAAPYRSSCSPSVWLRTK